ncbi:hypothetical protein ACIBG0_28100 [Nocardia sp. NPDC050630]|uniref:hypothetical protein n=1 Tax=Nocardia sp. NPDC050630 TaxID=3364321 RepID=UPI0037BCA83C
MTVARIVLLLIGIWLGWYGISALFDLPPADLGSVAIWFAGGILLHDAVFAPICVAAGLTARHLLPPTWWAVTACGAICSVGLVLIALPVLDRRNAMSSNPTVLDRNYPLGLAVALILVWLLVFIAHAVSSRSGRGHAHSWKPALRLPKIGRRAAHDVISTRAASAAHRPARHRRNDRAAKQAPHKRAR